MVILLNPGKKNSFIFFKEISFLMQKIKQFALQEPWDLEE